MEDVFRAKQKNVKKDTNIAMKAFTTNKDHAKNQIEKDHQLATKLYESQLASRWNPHSHTVQQKKASSERTHNDKIKKNKNKPFIDRIFNSVDIIDANSPHKTHFNNCYTNQS
eukprot:357323_1